MILGKLEEVMEAGVWTIQALAEAASLTPQTIMRARKTIGRCRLETLASIAAALDVRIKDLFEEESSAHPVGHKMNQ